MVGACMAMMSTASIGPKLAPFNPTANEAIELALKLCRLSSSDVVYDLGCGDGKFLLHTANTQGVRCVGVEYDAQIADRAGTKLAAWKAESITGGSSQDDASSVSIFHGDATIAPLEGGPVPPQYRLVASTGARDATLRGTAGSVAEDDPTHLPGPASVIFCYLVPAGLALVEPRLAHAVSTWGARVVTNMFRVPGWEERGWLRAKAVTKEGLAVYYYGLPEQKEGDSESTAAS